MPCFTILRTQKLKHKNSIIRSLKHAFREQDTPNADEELTPNNTHIGAENTAEGMAKIEDRLGTQDKIRKNAVLAIEYLITASPDAINQKSRADQDKYFQDSMKWLEERHGKENVVYAGIHRDEKSPHMYAYVVPIDQKGKLNCRAFLGGSKALNKMQTDFAEQVGKVHGFERGIEGSKAKHQKIKDWYAQVNSPVKKLDDVEVDLKPKVIEKGFFFESFEGEEAVKKRVKGEVFSAYERDIEAGRLTRSYAKRSREITETNKKLVADVSKMRNQIAELEEASGAMTFEEQKKVLAEARRKKAFDAAYEKSVREHQQKTQARPKKQKSNDLGY